MHFIRTNMMRAGIAALLAFGVMGAPSFVANGDEGAEEVLQDAATEPEVFITALVDKLRILASGSEEEAGSNATLQTVLAEDMATKRLQAYLLSREQRKKLSDAEISEYNNIFPLYISSAFAGSIDQLVSRTIKVNDVIERRPGDYIVRSQLFSDDGQARAGLDWRVLEVDGNKQLADVIVDGLSFSVERRAQFTAILNKDGFGALIGHMREIAGEDSAS